MRKTILAAGMLLALVLSTGAGLRRDADAGEDVLVPSYGGEEVLGTVKPPVTTGPDNSALYEKAAQYTGSESLSARLGDPEHIEREFASTDGSLTVTVNADVVIPDAEKAPLIRVTSGTITQADADILMDTLVRDTLYEPDTQPTKADLEQAIAETERKLAQTPEEDLEEVIGNTPDGPVTERQYLEEYLEQLRTEHETAPETVEPEPITGQFVKSEDDGEEFIDGENESEDFYVRVTGGLGGARASYERDGASTWPDDYAPASGELPEGVQDLTCTAAEAQAQCDAVVAKLGVEDMTLYSALKKVGGEPERCVWSLQYTRCLDGLPITYTRQQCDVLTDRDVYMVPWDYETMTFYVDDGGVAGFWWESPYELGEAVTEDSVLRSLDEVMAVYEKMLVVAYDNHDLISCMDFSSALEAEIAHDNDGADIRIDIDEIRLGYDRIAEMDKDGVGLLVPVWDFFGSITDGDGNVISDDPEASLFTINAVDGDVIDRGFGY